VQRSLSGPWQLKKGPGPMAAATRPKIAARAPLPPALLIAARAPLLPGRPIPRGRFTGGRPALGPMAAAKRPKIAAWAPLPPGRPTPRGRFTGARPALGPMVISGGRPALAPMVAARCRSKIAAGRRSHQVWRCYWWEARPRADGRGEVPVKDRGGAPLPQGCRSHQVGQSKEADSPVGGPPSGRWSRRCAGRSRRGRRSHRDAAPTRSANPKR
jgi:hypothetical protein